jgi:hypothetical protein
MVFPTTAYIHINDATVMILCAYRPHADNTGRLEFDFVSEQRPGKDDFILNDVRYAHV